MAFPILFIQGDVNDTFDRRGTLESARLIKRVLGGDHPVFRVSIEGYGHLDCVVGRDAPTLVYPRIGTFLRDEITQDTVTQLRADDLRLDPEEARLHLRQPVMGPWLGQVSVEPDGSLTTRLGMKVDDLRVPPPCIVSVLVVDDAVVPGTLVFHRIAKDGGPPWDGVISCVECEWKEGEAVIAVRVPPAVVASTGSHLSIRVCTPFFGSTIGWPANADEFLAVWAAERTRAMAGHRRPNVERERVDEVILHRHRLELLAQTAGTRFVLGSCRQTPLLIDRELADLPYLAIFERERDATHLLLVGDQIYADAMASVESIRGTRARFVDAHRESWCAPYQREVMRHMPVYMAIDDHEFTDNYDETTRREYAAEFRNARDTWWRYQLAAGPAGVSSADSGPAWYAFSQCHFHYFVCDTRSGREDGGRIQRQYASIADDRQRKALADWVCRTRAPGRRPRFIVLPSPPFPWFKSAGADPAYAVRSDAWQRFPSCIEWLLRLIWEDGSGQLVLLCGDYHIYADCTITLTSSSGDGRTVSCRCVATGGLYCPYAFANTSADELERVSHGTSTEFTWQSVITGDPVSGSGYTVVEADTGGNVRSTFVRS